MSDDGSRRASQRCRAATRRAAIRMLAMLATTFQTGVPSQRSRVPGGMALTNSGGMRGPVSCGTDWAQRSMPRSERRGKDLMP